MQMQAKEPIISEILECGNVEEVLAKYFGLSLMKAEVKVVKDAFKNDNEMDIHEAIEKMINRHKVKLQSVGFFSSPTDC